MTLRQAKKEDLKIIMDSDPAALSERQVRRTYAGYKALSLYRLAHALWLKGRKNLALRLSWRAKRKTGIDIHPAADIAPGVFIDHGVGVVIGETAKVGEGCVLYQGVTLGGTGKQTGKRHPTLERDVMASAGAKILGPVTIGEGSKIGAGSVVLKDVPKHCTVVGVPGRIVRQDGKRVEELDQVRLPDPMLEEIARLNARICELENKAGIHSCRYSLAVDGDNAPADELAKVSADEAKD